MKHTRRSFLEWAAGAATAATLLPVPVSHAIAEPLTQMHFSCNSYSWLTFYARSGKEWMADPESCMREYATSGLHGYEPGVTSVEEVHALGPLLKKYALEMRSVYVGTTLHEAGTAQQSIDSAVKIAMAAKALGTKIIVTNPSPIQWGTPEDKDDVALATQAANLEKLGSLLKAQGMTLAYHNHDMELRQGAREFHHMLSSTDPRFVSFCLDVHWVYRGTGNSQVALFDILRLYGKRIVELHLRQSANNIWLEVFGTGDINYNKLVTELVRLRLKPHLVLEQCLEEKSPNTTDVVTAHREGLKYAAQLFAPLQSQ